MIDRLNAEQAQREAALQFEVERKAQDAKQQAELQRALDEARKAREALTQAERQRAQADAAAEQAKATVAAAQVERNAAAAREDELRKAQQKLLADQASASTQSASERSTAVEELERKLLVVAAEARAAQQALASAEAKQKATEWASEEARAVARLANQRDTAVRVAALPDVSLPAAGPQPQHEDLPRRLQAELKRVGCYAGEVDGNWGAGSRTGLETFARTTGFSFKDFDATPEALNAVSSQRGRICPLRCSTGEVEQGGKCVVARSRDPEPKANGGEPSGASSPRIRATPPGNLSAYSLTYWPRNTLTLGQTVTASTPFGRLSCTSTGRDRPRDCSIR